MHASSCMVGKPKDTRDGGAAIHAIGALVGSELSRHSRSPSSINEFQESQPAFFTSYPLTKPSNQTSHKRLD